MIFYQSIPNRGLLNEVETDNPIKEADINLIQVYPSVCKICFQNIKGTGFLIKLYKNNRELLCLLTNEHVIKEEFVESNQTIYIYYNYEKDYKVINLNKSERFIKCYKDLDVTLIEIIKSDNIDNKYFLIPNLYKIFVGNEICIPQFPKGKLSYSYGKIKEINDFTFVYDAGTNFGSSGSPIFLKDTTKVIGIHKQGNTEKLENYGTLIYSIIELLQNENNNSNISNIGKLYNNKGDCYIGQTINKLPNGKGKLYNKNGEFVYEGQFVNGIEEGKGKKIKDGKYYIGNFIGGKMFGKGEIYFKEGDIKYLGEFAYDKKEGLGKYYFDEQEYSVMENNKKFYFIKGDYYIGYWHNDKMNGKGKIKLKDGRTKYEGDFVDNKFQGIGIYYFESGDYYFGQFFNNMQHGKGKIYNKNGRIEFEGNFVNDKMEGIGKLYLSDGNYFIGNFMNGEIHGKGKFYLKNGTSVYDCQFVNGKLTVIEKNLFYNFNKYIGEIMKTKMFSKKYN